MSALRGLSTLAVATVAGVMTFFLVGALVGALSGVIAALGIVEVHPRDISSVSLGLSIVAAMIVTGKVLA